jgi:erythrin-vacuolar iron transport family protein
MNAPRTDSSALAMPLTAQTDSSRRPAAATTNERTSEREHRPRLVRRPSLGTPGGATPPSRRAQRNAFLLQRAQPALSGLIDGSLSSLAPIFSVVLATHTPRYAFYAGLATAIGAGVSMSFSEGLSDTGEDTGRGNPRVRGAITGAGTFIGGFLHTLPFLIPSYTTALVVAILVVMFELATLAFLRMHFFKTSFATSLLNVALAGLIIVGASAALGSAAS